jgi:hypothetical protein
MTAARSKKHLCSICRVRPGAPVGWCAPCRKSYDRSLQDGDGTILSTIMWAVKRARYFALRGKRP